MQAFSRTLVELYRLAEQVPANEFPAGVLQLLHPWIGFDGAVLGMGEANAGAQANLQIVQAHVHQREPTMLSDYAEVSAIDPVTGAFLNGLDAPLPVDCRSLYRERHLRSLHDFACKHELRHLMLYGDRPTADHPGRWMVLYRGRDAAFSAQEADYLHAAWFHVSRAIEISHARLLEQLDLERAQRASALLNLRGAVEAADPHFLALLQREWPEHQGKTLPPPLREHLERGHVYRGRHVEIMMKRQGDFIVCLAHAADAPVGLTPGEQAVARRFAAGLSAKEIARELGVSPNTVRSQLSSLYAKLGVHNKAALAQALRGGS